MNRLFFYLTCLSGVTVACQPGKQDQVVVSPKDETPEVEQLPVPDSLLTDEQKLLRDKFREVILDHLKIENNQLVYDLTREEFLKSGVPVKYYDQFLLDVETLNQAVQQDSTLDLEQIRKDSHLEDLFP